MKVLKTSDKIDYVRSILSEVCFNLLNLQEGSAFSIYNYTVKIIKSIV